MEFKEELFNIVNCEIIPGEMLSKHTWYKIGGKCNFFVYSKNYQALLNVLKTCKKFGIEYFLIGDGANLLVSDSGFNGIIISLRRYMNEIELSGDNVTVEAGAKMSDLILFCEKRELSGFEYLSGIPGTIGGMLMMNAGTDNSVISDFLLQVTVVRNEEIVTIQRDEINFGYRSAPELQNSIILKAEFGLSKSNNIDLKKIREKIINQRREKQPLNYPSCGSVFKRPENDYAGRLIESCGLKGYRVGDAEVSTKHAGFIINKGNAKAKDVFTLMIKIRNEINNKYNVLLEPEVKFLGFSENELIDII